MIKIWPDSVDANTLQPMGSFLFVKDLVAYNPDFEKATSAETADCIMIPQFSNNVNDPYLFDRQKANYLASLKKPIVLQNDGGGIPAGWKQSEIGEYIWGEWSDLVKVFFSVECYPWHRSELPTTINYVPFDFIGYSEMGLGLREIFPLQSRHEYVGRYLATSVAMSVYPPTRDRLWELLWENNWPHYSFNTNPSYYPFDTSRVSWEVMTSSLKSAKIGFAPDGATAKTERQLFTPSLTTMMMQEDSVEFPYEWVDGFNCLKLEHDFVAGYERDKEQEYKMNGHNLRILNKERTKNKILNWLDRPDQLYEIYANGWRNDENYRLPNYFKNHIGETIKKYL